MENQLYKNRVSRAVKQDSEKEKQAGHFQNQKQSACISRIQSNNGCDGIPTDITVRLMIDTVAFAITNSVFQTVTGFCFPLLSGSINGSSITG